jgi:hypothetical protein
MLSFPATVTRPDFTGCFHCSWLPFLADLDPAVVHQHPSNRTIIHCDNIISSCYCHVTRADAYLLSAYPYPAASDRWAGFRRPAGFALGAFAGTSAASMASAAAVSMPCMTWV